jgi:hypothetical protein
MSLCTHLNNRVPRCFNDCDVLVEPVWMLNNSNRLSAGSSHQLIHTQLLILSSCQQASSSDRTKVSTCYVAIVLQCTETAKANLHMQQRKESIK